MEDEKKNIILKNTKVDKSKAEDISDGALFILKCIANVSLKYGMDFDKFDKNQDCTHEFIGVPNNLIDSRCHCSICTKCTSVSICRHCLDLEIKNMEFNVEVDEI